MLRRKRIGREFFVGGRNSREGVLKEVVREVGGEYSKEMLGKLKEERDIVIFKLEVIRFCYFF